MRLKHLTSVGACVWPRKLAPGSVLTLPLGLREEKEGPKVTWEGMPGAPGLGSRLTFMSHPPGGCAASEVAPTGESPPSLVEKGWEEWRCQHKQCPCPQQASQQSTVGPEPVSGCLAIPWCVRGHTAVDGAVGRGLSLSCLDRIGGPLGTWSSNASCPGAALGGGRK